MHALCTLRRCCGDALCHDDNATRLQRPCSSWSTDVGVGAAGARGACAVGADSGPHRHRGKQWPATRAVQARVAVDLGAGHGVTHDGPALALDHLHPCQPGSVQDPPGIFRHFLHALVPCNGANTQEVQLGTVTSK